MEQSEADACYFRSKELAKRVHEYVKQREVEFKQRERYNRYPRQLPPSEAVAAVLTDEQLDAFTAELLIKELGRTGSAQLALALLDLLTSSHASALSKAAFDATITVCSTQYLAGEAVRVYRLLPHFGFVPDVHTCNMTITACSQGGDVQGVLEILGDMQRQGITLNDFTALMALQACMYKRKGRHQEAVAIMRQLLDAGRAPSGEVCDAVLAVCEAAMDKAPDLESAQAAFEGLADLNLHSCTRAYNAVLRACAKRGAWQVAQGYFDEMMAAGVPTNTHIFNSLITACLVGGALQNALAIFEWMVSGRRVTDDIQADISTYNILIKACHQAGHLEKALEIMAWLEQSGVQFDNTTYEELIGTAEIAEIWDMKAVRDASQQALAVFPEHLRPAPFDAMRLTYLEHLNELAEEEALAYAKLGGTSWVSSSLTKGSKGLIGTGAEGLAPVFVKTSRWTSASPLLLSRVPSLKADASSMRGGPPLTKGPPTLQLGIPDVSPRSSSGQLMASPGVSVRPSARDTEALGLAMDKTSPSGRLASGSGPRGRSGGGLLPALGRAEGSAGGSPLGATGRSSVSPATSTGGAGGRLSPQLLARQDPSRVSVS